MEAGGGAALVEAGATQPPSTSGREAADDVAAPLHRPAASLMSGLPQRSAAGDGEGFCIGSSAVGAAFFQRRCGAGRPATVGGSSEEQAGPGQESAAGRGGEVGPSATATTAALLPLAPAPTDARQAPALLYSACNLLSQQLHQLRSQLTAVFPTLDRPFGAGMRGGGVGAAGGMAAGGGGASRGGGGGGGGAAARQHGGGGGNVLRRPSSVRGHGGGGGSGSWGGGMGLSVLTGGVKRKRSEADQLDGLGSPTLRSFGSLERVPPPVRRNGGRAAWGKRWLWVVKERGGNRSAPEPCPPFFLLSHRSTSRLSATFPSPRWQPARRPLRHGTRSTRHMVRGEGRGM